MCKLCHMTHTHVLWKVRKGKLIDRVKSLEGFSWCLTWYTRQEKIKEKPSMPSLQMIHTHRSVDLSEAKAEIKTKSRLTIVLPEKKIS